MLFLLACVHSPPEGTHPASTGSYGPAAPVVAAPFAGQTPWESLPVVSTPSGLRYWVIRDGSGPLPVAGQKVKLHYTGWLENGTKFDSSYDRGQPIAYTHGVGQVIKGWDETVSMMKVGERRRIEVPAEIAYGSRARGPIPANATLIFEMELVEIGPGY